MPTENKIQSLVHKLEEGGWAKWIRLAAFLAFLLAVSYLWLFGGNGFKGLAHPRAFEQAEIAREIARGHGFSTKMIRPAALYQFRTFKGKFPIERTPDTYHAPLWPVLLAPCVWLVKSTWEMTTKDVLYESDRVIALLALVFFLLSVFVNYRIAHRLFDHRLAVISIWLIVLCDQFWQFSMSGLPQMLMLFLFSCAAYCLLRAVEAREAQLAELPQDEPPAAGETTEARSGAEPESEPASASARTRHLDGPRLFRHPLPWLIATALLFGLLALTHALTIWMFVGVLVFCIIYFRPAGLYAGIMLAVFLACYIPWLVRNQEVCGAPFGVSWYSGLYQIRGSESSIMRSMDPPLSGVTPGFFRRKFLSQTNFQFSQLIGFFGNVIPAIFFFISLLHRFKRKSAAMFRWCVLLCWLAAVFGMSLFGLDDQTLKANDLHILFVPLTTFYGLAFILVLWSRLEIRVRLAEVAFITLIFLVSMRSFVVSFIDLLGTPANRVQWPPYVPPYISILASWTKEDEIIMSDMPWAVAWYADRKSLWLPTSITDFTNLNDYNLLQGRIVGMYLTPVSGDSAFLTDIVKGDYKEWAPFIMRSANLRSFPLKAVTALPIDNECVFYADRDRWSLRED